MQRSSGATTVLVPDDWPVSSGLHRVLIVEDEFLIADSIARHLVKRGHTVVGKAISYEDAVAAYAEQQPDIALVDIRLSGQKTGIDFARFLKNEPAAIPFIYLTAQSDPATVDFAKETLPSGFLGKPVQMDSMLSMVSIAMHNHQVRMGQERVTLRVGVGENWHALVCWCMQNQIYGFENLALIPGMY